MISLIGTLPTSLPKDAWLNSIGAQSYLIFALSHNHTLALPYYLYLPKPHILKALPGFSPSTSNTPYPIEHCRFIPKTSLESVPSFAFLRICSCFSPSCLPSPGLFHLVSLLLVSPERWTILHIIHQFHSLF